MMTRIMRLITRSISLLLGFMSGALLSAEPLRIAVSVLPLESVVEAIGGDAVEVRSLQREGDSCSVFEPRPSAVAWLSEASVFMRTGVAYETVLLHKIEDRFSDLKIVDLRRPGASDGHAVTCTDPSHDHGHHDEHAHHDHHDHNEHEHGAPDHHAHADHGHDHHDHAHSESGDTHLWLDPLELIRIADLMAGVILEERPELGPQVESNLASFKARARQLDADIRAELAPYAGRSFLIYHPALSLFAAQYGLQQVSIHGSTELGPRGLSERIKEAQAEGVRSIFVQPQESRRQAEIIASALEAELVEIDPMGREWEATLRSVTAALVASFEREAQ